MNKDLLKKQIEEEILQFDKLDYSKETWQYLDYLEYLCEQDKALNGDTTLITFGETLIYNNDTNLKNFLEKYI